MRQSAEQYFAQEQPQEELKIEANEEAKGEDPIPQRRRVTKDKSRMFKSSAPASGCDRVISGNLIQTETEAITNNSVSSASEEESLPLPQCEIIRVRSLSNSTVNTPVRLGEVQMRETFGRVLEMFSPKNL